MHWKVVNLEEINTHTFSVIVENKSGVLGRVVGMFAARGYNIESLTVAEVDEDQNLSRVTVMVTGTLMVIAQIKAQLEKTLYSKEVDGTIISPCTESLARPTIKESCKFSWIRIFTEDNSCS